MKRFLTFLLVSALSCVAQVNSARMLSGINAQTGSSYLFVAQDSTRITTFSNGAGVAVTLPSGTTTNFGAGAVFSAKNIGSGTATITCSSCTINATGTPSGTLALPSGQNVDLYSDGVNYTAFLSLGTPPSSGSASPGFSLPARWTYNFGRGDVIQTNVGHAIGSCLGSQSNFSPTATETSGRVITSSGTASTNTVISCGAGGGGNPGQGFLSIGTLGRFSTRLMIQTTASFRWWIGVVDSSGGEFGSGNSTWSSNTPNRNYCAFRLAAGTDSTYKAICATSNAAQTVVDTLTTPVTTVSTVFEISFTPIFAPTQANFFINGTQVATVSTNLPSASFNLAEGFFGDNENTNTSGSLVFFWNELIETK